MKIQYYETLINNNFSKIRIEMFKHIDIMPNKHVINLQYVKNNIRNATYINHNLINTMKVQYYETIVKNNFLKSTRKHQTTLNLRSPPNPVKNHD